MSFYLDASILVPLFTAEQASAVAERFLARISTELLLTEFACSEITSAFSRRVRTEELSRVEAEERLAAFDDWRGRAARHVEVVEADVRLAHAYVRRFELKLRTPDALHAAITRRLGATLVTLDQRLASAAGELGIEAVVPE